MESYRDVRVLGLSENEKPEIMVAEDSLPTLEFLHKVLESLGAAVHSVSDGEEAAKLLTLQRFDAIFLDLCLPKVDGYELIGRARKSSWNRTTPIVVLTGSEDEEALEKAFLLGAVLFLKKPINRRQLSHTYHTVRSAMAKRLRIF